MAKEGLLLKAYMKRQINLKGQFDTTDSQMMKSKCGNEISV